MLSGALCGVSFVFLLFINLNKHVALVSDDVDVEESVGLLREETLVGEEPEIGTHIRRNKLIVGENSVDA